MMRAIPFDGGFLAAFHSQKFSHFISDDACGFQPLFVHDYIIKLMTNNPLGEWLSKLALPTTPASADLLSGVTIISAIARIIPNYTVRLNLNTTPSARINNWNVVINELQKLGIRVGQQQKSKILNGDEKTVYAILHELKHYYQKHKEEADMDLSKIDARGEPKSARSLLELFILVIIKHYGFSVKEAVALLSNDSKYLAHILAKGFKEKSKPVEDMISELIELLPQINTFCKVKENEVFFLKSIKPGLISKFLTVSELSLQLLTAFTKGITEKYQILKNQLMPTIVLSLRRHSDMLGPIISAINQMVGHNKNILSLFLMNASPGEVDLLMLEMCNQYEQQGKGNEVFEQFKIQQFTRNCIQNLKKPQLFINAGAFLMKVVEHNYVNFAADSQNLVKLVDSLSNVTLSKKGEVIVHINILFSLLQQFGRRKNAIAPQLLNVAVQRYRNTLNEDQSQNYLHNFVEIVDYFPSIPTAAISQAILSRYQSSTTSIKQLQFDFLVGSLSTINEKIALRLINSLTKVFVEEVGFVEYVSKIFQSVIRKFDSKAIFDACVKSIKVFLSVHYGNLRKLSYSKSLVDGVVKVDRTNVNLKIKNLEVQRLLVDVLKIKNDKLNDAIEPLICYSFIQSELKNKQESEGLKKAMLMLGTEEDLRKLYETDAKMMLQDSKDSKKKTQSKQKQKDKDKEQSKMRVNSDASLLNKKRNLFTTLNPPKIAADAQKGLQKYSKNFLQKVGKLSLQQQKRAQQQQRREQLRKKIAVRMVQQGINISAGKPIPVNCLFEFNSRDKQSVSDYSYLPFYDEEAEDDRDVKGLQYLFKRYNKLFKLYYTNYSKLRLANIKSFDDLSERGNLMQSANVWKLLRDHQLDEYITVNEVQYIVQRINAHFKKDYRDSSLLDYQAFQNFIIQAALAIFSRPPRDMRSRPISEMVQQIINRFRERAPENHIDVSVFEQSQPVQASKPQQLRDLNEKLKKNPEFILPQGYKKLTTKKLVFQYKIHLQSFDSSYADVLQVLDQIFNQKMGIRLIEPYSITYVQAVAKPILYQTLVDSTMRERSLSSVFPRQSRFLKEKEGEGLGGNMSRGENKFSREKRLKQQEKALKEAEQLKRREQRDREVKAMLQKHRERQAQVDRKRQQQRQQQLRKAQEQRRRKERYEQQLKRKVSEYAQKKRIDKQKQEQQSRRRKQQQSKNLQRMKAEMEVKRRMIEQSRQKKKEEQNMRIQREAAQIKKRQEQNKIKLLQRKEKTIKMLEDYRYKRQKEREESEQKLKQSQQSVVNIAVKSKRVSTPSSMKLSASRQKSSKKVKTPAKQPHIQQNIDRMQQSMGKGAQGA